MVPRDENPASVVSAPSRRGVLRPVRAWTHAMPSGWLPLGVVYGIVLATTYTVLIGLGSNLALANRIGVAVFAGLVIAPTLGIVLGLLAGLIAMGLDALGLWRAPRQVVGAMAISILFGAVAALLAGFNDGEPHAETMLLAGGPWLLSMLSMLVPLPQRQRRTGHPGPERPAVDRPQP